MNLRHKTLLVFAFIVGSVSAQQTSVDYVDTRIGSARKTDGGTMPSVTSPFGRTHFTVMTGQNHIGTTPYHYEDDKVIGFMATHQSAPWVGDYGDVVFWPTLGEGIFDENKRAFYLDHAKESARPHKYRAELKHNQTGTPMVVEMTSDGDAAIVRFDFDKAVNAEGLMFEASREKGMSGYICVDPERNIVYGYNTDRQQAHLGAPLSNFKGHFYFEFNKKIKEFGCWSNEEKYAGVKCISGEYVGAYITFEHSEEPTEVRLSTSFISQDQALRNFKKSLDGQTLESLCGKMKILWNGQLDRVQASTKSNDERTIFYTAMYHTQLYPRIFSEDGQYYSAFDDQFHCGNSYTDFSTWDSFRAHHPWLILTSPERVCSMITAMLQMYKEGGWLPKWPNPGETGIMIGSHADAIIADAYVNGFRDYDIELAYEAIRKNAFTPPYGDQGGDKHYVGSTWNFPKPDFRPSDAGNYWWDRGYYNGGVESRGGLTWYMKYGYVPVDYTAESVSRTVEFGIDDYCIAQMAKAMGKMDDYSILMERSRYYKNLYNPATGFLAPRLHDGRWFEENPNTGFCEGNNWTYLFGAMHDPEGMITIMGGKEIFSMKLDENFSGRHYRHDNEPGHHYLYLYNWTDEFYKTQERAREEWHKNYTADPAYGINGNDDLGQMSAWYLFTSLGFYPVAPASGVYAIGAPQFETASIQIGDKLLKIIAHNLSEANLYVKRVVVNGKVLDQALLPVSMIKNGGTIEFYMTNKPVKSFKKPLL